MHENFNPVVSALVVSTVPTNCRDADYDVVNRINSALSKRTPAERAEVHSLSKTDNAQKIVFRVDCTVSSLKNVSQAIKNALSACEVDIRPVP